MFDSTPHKVYDASLIKNANLHRFLNKAGEPYSAIYVLDLSVKVAFSDLRAKMHLETENHYTVVY